jgi:hypothetical protein
MRFEATKSSLIAEARAALAAADRERRQSARPKPHTQPRSQESLRPTPEAPDEDRRHTERQQAIDDIARELASIDESALERARADMEMAVNRYVTAASVYNRILVEIRQQLLDTGGISEDDIAYCPEPGRSGLRIKGVARAQTLPWQTVSQVALAALRMHAPTERTSRDSPGDSDTSYLTPPHQAQPEVVPDAATLSREDIQSLVAEQTKPVLGFVHDQQAEIASMRARIDDQAAEIERLRLQLQQQARGIERASAFLDALHDAQSRLH